MGFYLDVLARFSGPRLLVRRETNVGRASARRGGWRAEARPTGNGMNDDH